MSSTQLQDPDITVQLCTYNRRALLGAVLEALFHQDLAPDRYEIVLVDDGSTDGTYEGVLAALAPPCRFTLVRQRNAGLAAGRNAGIRRARGRIIVFMDDDVLATPGLLAAHLRFHERHPDAICRGAVINVSSFEQLPPAVYGMKNFSAAYFWTTNVSAPLALIKSAGGFDERFREYGWEDLELGFRLRRRGVPSILARDALVYHYKPPLRPMQFDGLAAQARAQARTAKQFLSKHPHWRIALATGQVTPQLWWSAFTRRSGWPGLLHSIAAPGREATRLPLGVRRWAAQRWARAAYFEELQRKRDSA